MSRTQKFERRYGANSPAVLLSISKVAAAGKSGDPAIGPMGPAPPEEQDPRRRPRAMRSRR
jgi:hypothetical protein